MTSDYKKTLILGGMRSGKSRYALTLAQNKQGLKIFLATAEALDEGMRDRIAKHQQERAAEFLTVEEPLYLARALRNLPPAPGVILIDCLTLWINNLLFYFPQDPQSIARERVDFFSALKDLRSDVILVSNEIGWGVLSENKLARNFVDELGRLNQEIAQVCDEVILMVSGLPQYIKQTIPQTTTKATADYVNS